MSRIELDIRGFSSNRPKHTSFWIVILDVCSKLRYVWFRVVNESSSYTLSGVHIVHSVNKEINHRCLDLWSLIGVVT